MGGRGDTPSLYNWYLLATGVFCGDLGYLWGCTLGNGVKLVFGYTVLGWILLLEVRMVRVISG